MRQSDRINIAPGVRIFNRRHHTIKRVHCPVKALVALSTNHANALVIITVERVHALALVWN